VESSSQSTRLDSTQSCWFAVQSVTTTTLQSQSDTVSRLARCSARPSDAALRYAVSLIFPWTPPPPAPPLCIPGCRLPTMTSSLSAYFRSSRSTRRPSPTTAGERHAPVSCVCHAPYASARQYRFYRRFLPEKRDVSRWGFLETTRTFFSSAALRAPDMRTIASDLCDRARCLGLQSIAKCLPYTQVTPLETRRGEKLPSRAASRRVAWNRVKWAVRLTWPACLDGVWRYSSFMSTDTSYIAERRFLGQYLAITVRRLRLCCALGE